MRSDARQIRRHRTALLAVLALTLLPRPDASAAPAEDAVDYERYVDVLRVPLDGVPLRAAVSVALDFPRAEAVVTIERTRGLARDLLERTRAIVAERGGAIVTGVDPAPDAEDGVTLRYLLATPAVRVDVLRSRRRRTWFLEVYTLRRAPLRAAPLPLQRYAEYGALPVWGKSMSLATEAALERLAAIEAAFLAGDDDGAQKLLDELREIPPEVAPWAALLQAEAHARAGRREEARATLSRVARGTKDVSALLLSRMRLAELGRSVGQDIAPAALLAYADQVDNLPLSVRTELQARRTRGLFLEGRFVACLRSFRALRRMDPTHPALEPLSELVRTAQFRVIRDAVAADEPVRALVADASLGPGPEPPSTARRSLPFLAAASRRLTLFQRESRHRLARLVEPLGEDEAVRSLVALVRSYLDAGSDARARMTLEYIEQEHGRDASDAVLATLRGAFALRDGESTAALEALRDGLALHDTRVARLRAARLAGALEGPGSAAALLAPLARPDADGAAPAGVAVGPLALELRAAADCPALVAEVAGSAPTLALAAPRAALALARCVRRAGGPGEALPLLTLVAATAPPVVARAARAEIADLRWEHRNATRLARFAPPAPAGE